MAGKKILIIVGDGGESYETWFAVHRFQEAGYATVVAAPSKKRMNLVMHPYEFRTVGHSSHSFGPVFGAAAAAGALGAVVHRAAMLRHLVLDARRGAYREGIRLRRHAGAERRDDRGQDLAQHPADSTGAPTGAWTSRRSDA